MDVEAVDEGVEGATELCSNSQISVSCSYCRIPPIQRYSNRSSAVIFRPASAVGGAGDVGKGPMTDGERESAKGEGPGAEANWG